MSNTVAVNKTALYQALHAMKRCAREAGADEWKVYIDLVEDALNNPVNPVNPVKTPAPRVFKYIRKHIPSGAESRMEFSEFEYNRLGYSQYEGMRVPDAQALIDTWNHNMPGTYHYTLD